MIPAFEHIGLVVNFPIITIIYGEDKSSLYNLE